MGQWVLSIVSYLIVSYCPKCEITSRRFQPGERPSSGLLRDCEIFAKPRLKL